MAQAGARDDARRAAAQWQAQTLLTTRQTCSQKRYQLPLSRRAARVVAQVGERDDARRAAAQRQAQTVLTERLAFSQKKVTAATESPRSVRRGARPLQAAGKET